MLNQAQLARVLLPVGELAKADVRAIATRLGLRTAAKPDSQDVCFITSSSGRDGFLGRRLTFTPGRVVDRGGRMVGAVPAVELVTIGQRRGLGVAGGGPSQYALEVDVPSATVVVGDAGALLSSSVALEHVSWADRPHDGDVLAQCSAHGEPRPASFDSASGVLTWAASQRLVAPGQAVVLYDGDEVIGGGINRQPTVNPR
jgi:tRNA-specific 2-thiouridylase